MRWIGNEIDPLEAKRDKEKYRETTEKTYRWYNKTSGTHWFELAQERSAWRDEGEANVQQTTDKGWRWYKVWILEIKEVSDN